MNIVENCCICLKKYLFLEPLDEKDDNKICSKDKLETCVPSENWYREYKICKNCSEQLELAYQFVLLCAKHGKLRKTLHERFKKPFYCASCDKSYSSEQYLKHHILKFHDNHLNHSTENELEQIGKYDKKIIETVYEEKQLNESEHLEQDKIVASDDLKEEKFEDIPFEFAEAPSPPRSNSVCSYNSEDLKPLKQLANKPRKIKRKKHVRKIIKCEGCDINFKTRELLKKHNSITHLLEKPYKCNQCDARYMSHASLAIHKRWHTDERPYICNICGKGFRCLKTMKVHQETHSNVRGYPCDKCGKSYKTDSNLRMHKQIVHTNPEDYKYVCSKCGKKTPSKSNLDSHMKRSHAGERNFECHICNKKFLFNHEVNTHVRRKHRDERLYGCEVCKKGYKSSYGLKKHLKTAHNIGEFRGNLAPVKKHLCPYCPKMFPYNNKLQRHILTHTGEKPFKCEICPKGFREQCGLRAHMKNDHQIELND